MCLFKSRHLHLKLLKLCSSLVLLGVLIPTAQAALPVCQQAGSDSDGDGYGWEQINGTFQSCKVTNATPNNSNPGQNQSSGGSFGPEDITDIILTAGQSNAVASNSVTSNANQSVGSEDVPANPGRIFVWVNGDWTQANLDTQIWHVGTNNDDPRPTFRDSNGNIAYGIIRTESKLTQSHGGYQIARSILETEPDKVIGIIPTGASGMPIQFWVTNNQDRDNNGTYSSSSAVPWGDYSNSFENTNSLSFTSQYSADIGSTVNSALNHWRLGSHKTIDLVWWMQGESNDSFTNGYQKRLEKIMSGVKNKMSSNGVFIANEIIRNDNGFNTDLKNYLNYEDDNSIVKTCSSDLGFLRGDSTTAENTQHRVDSVHFSKKALYKIGNNVASRYLEDTACRSLGGNNSGNVDNGNANNGNVEIDPTGICGAGDYDNAENHDGWGWDQTQSDGTSCPPKYNPDPENENSTGGQPTSGGLGNQCIIPVWPDSSRTVPICAANPNSTGWGWENNLSCINRGGCDNIN